MVEKSLVKVELVLESFLAHLAVGKVDVEEDEILEIQLKDAAFLVKSRDPHARGDCLGGKPGVGRNAAVPLFNGGIGPMGGVTGNREHLFGSLVLLELGLLEQEDVGIKIADRCEKIFFRGSPEAVDVPGNQPYRFLSHVILA
jgi:hypothetical protein